MNKLLQILFVLLLSQFSGVVLAQSDAPVSDVLVIPASAEVPAGAEKISEITRNALPVKGFEYAVSRMATEALKRGGNALHIRDVKYPTINDRILVRADVYRIPSIAYLIAERKAVADSLLRSIASPNSSCATIYVVRPKAGMRKVKLHQGDSTIYKISNGQRVSIEVCANAPVAFWTDQHWRRSITVQPAPGRAALLDCSITPGLIRGASYVRRVQSYYGVEQLLGQPAEEKHEQVIEPVFRNRIHFTPLKIIGTVNPGWELGYERMIGRRYSVKVFGALLNDDILKNYETYSGKRYGIEAKRFTGFSTGVDAYVSLELARNEIGYAGAYEFSDTGVQRQRHSYADTIGVANNNLVVNIKVGMQQRFGRFMLDLYGGLGIKYKNVQHSGRLYPDDQLYSRHPNAFNIAAREMNGATISIPLNLTVAYCFGGKTRTRIK